MPDNKFSGSVDEILENLKQQPTPDPASDRAVEDILAGLGLEEKLPRSARQAAPAALPAREQKPGPGGRCRCGPKACRGRVCSDAGNAAARGGFRACFGSRAPGPQLPRAAGPGPAACR